MAIFPTIEVAQVKRKEVRGDQCITGYRNQIFKCRSRFNVKRSGVKLGEIIKDLRHFYSQNFKKNKMFCESYELLKTLCQIWFFGQISFI
jgi:hypothetical protein